MVGYFPAEIVAQWIKETSQPTLETSKLPDHVQYIAMPQILCLENEHVLDIYETVNDFIYLNIFLGKTEVKIITSLDDEKALYLLRKTLINNSFTEKYFEVQKNLKLEVNIELKKRVRALD